MSLVGPRPLLMQYMDRYTPEQSRRHEVKPGMTGWAQVNGRNNVTWPEKFALDIWYVDHWSLLVGYSNLVSDPMASRETRTIFPNKATRPCRNFQEASAINRENQKSLCLRRQRTRKGRCGHPDFQRRGGIRRLRGRQRRAAGRHGYGSSSPGNGEWLRQEASNSRVAVAIGTGESRFRQLLAERCSRWGIDLLTVVHPAATVSRAARLGPGTVVMAGAIINPEANVGHGRHRKHRCHCRT